MDQYSPIEQKVLEIIRAFVAELGTDRAVRAVSLEASLDRDLGLGSLERVELLLQIEKAFSIRLQDHLVAEARTPRDLASAILCAKPPKQSLGLDRHPFIGEASPPPIYTATLTEVLLRRAEAEPDRPHIYLPQEEAEEQIITYRLLLDAATATARGLVERGLHRGETVALMLPTGADFFYAFIGILLAGGIPVPLYPPFRADQIEEYANRQVAILRKAGARLLVISQVVEGLARLLKPFVPVLAGITTVDALRTSSAELPNLTLRGDDAALIQFTSGSTSDPKGVLLDHQSILANIRAVGQAAQIRPTDVGVSWLPLYHDMGLIGSWLCCLYFGIPIAILSPQSFLNRPERWLWAIHYHQATLSAAPNFAYELCVRKIEDRVLEGLDLSSWRIAFNGAEPVSPDTLDRFTQRFAPYGFRRETFFPVYGLAESSVALTFPPIGRAPRVDRIMREPFERHRRTVPASPSERSPLRFVSCGIPLPGHEVRMVDDDGQEVGERIEGALQFKGPSVMKGYFQDPEATWAVFHDGWWDSGDLAYRAEGEIFITGRRKDVIIKAGRNLSPQEVEEVASEVKGVRKGCVVAFGVTDPRIGTEKLVVVAETREERNDIRERLTAEVVKRIATTIGTPPDVVLIVPPGVVPKTSSGKLRRAACREAYLRGDIVRRRRAPWLQITKLLVAGFWARAQRGMRALGSLIYAGYVGILFLATLLPVWLATTMLPTGRTAARLSRSWACGLLWLSGCPLTVEGRHHLVGTGPLVLVANHSSYLDAVALIAALPTGFIFVAKREFNKTPIIRTFIRKAGHLTVDRMDFSKSTADTKRIEAVLQRGLSVLIFAEGTMSRVKGLRPFKLGAFKVAVETARPVCPIAIRGTREILWPGRWLPRQGPIKVIIGKPISSKVSDWREIIRLRDAAKAEIARHCGEPPLDLVAAGIPPV